MWALYAGLDKLLYAWFKAMRPSSELTVEPGLLTGGLVGVPEAQQFAVLPSVPAGLTALLSIGSMLPALLHVWRKPHPRVFLPALVYCECKPPLSVSSLYLFLWPCDGHPHPRPFAPPHHPVASRSAAALSPPPHLTLWCMPLRRLLVVPF